MQSVTGRFSFRFREGWELQKYLESTQSCIKGWVELVLKSREGAKEELIASGAGKRFYKLGNSNTMSGQPVFLCSKSCFPESSEFITTFGTGFSSSIDFAPLLFDLGITVQRVSVGMMVSFG